MTDPATSAAALQRYTGTVRRLRTRYAAVLTAIVIVVAALVVVAWSRGEIANTSLQTVSRAPAVLPLSQPSTDLQVAWRTTDRAALGTPQWLGTVIVYSKNTVRGLNARTGAQTWSYTRTNRTTCTAIQAGGTTFAVFEVNGNCDEVTALDSGTGVRRWTRTLDQDGLPVNGRPDISVLSYTVMFTTPTVIYAIDPGSGFNRWTYSIPGCTIERAVLGTGGALISQSCTTPKCATLRYCARGPQLLLRDGSQGRDDKSQVNPDHILWAKNGNTSIPVSADAVLSTLDPSLGRLDLLLAANGDVSDQITVPAHPGSPDTQAVSADSAELVYLRGVTYAVTSGRTTPLWSLATPGPPSLVSGTGQDVPELSGARLTVASEAGIDELDGTTGQALRATEVTPPPAGASVRPLGTGYLVSSAAGTLAYR